MELKSYLASQTEKIDRRLAELVPQQNTVHAHLYEAARHSLLGPGKRIRPILTLATTEALGGNCDQALSPACALELVHTYSLIHDDLPCMDNDDFRRGRPTLHRVYPEGHAVLTGDFLLTYAFEVLADDPLLNGSQRLALISRLARHAGGEGMIAGQVLDIAAEGKQLDLAALQQIHMGKTAAMLTASVEFGGIVSNASPSQMLQLHSFGQKIGLAFQIVDDILDVTASHDKHGRAVASDIVNNKTTYVSLLGIEQARRSAEQLLLEAYDALESLPLKGQGASILRQLAELIVNRKG